LFVAQHRKPATESVSTVQSTPGTGPASIADQAAAARASVATQPRFDPATTRTVLTLIDADTSQPVPGGRVHMAYFYAGGVGEGHKMISNGEGKVALPFANKEGDDGAN